MNEYYVPFSTHLLPICSLHAGASQYLSIRISWYIRRNRIVLTPSYQSPITPMEHLPNKVKTLVMEQLMES